MANPLGTTVDLIKADESGGNVLASSAVLMVVKGLAELSFMVTQGSVPTLKNGQGIERSTLTGVKTKGLSRLQTHNELNITLHEREGMTANEVLKKVLMDGSNGKLEIEWWQTDGEFVKSKLMETAHHGMVLIEEGMEFDVEGSESPATRTFTLSCHVIPSECEVDENFKGEANRVIGGLKTVDGLANC